MFPIRDHNPSTGTPWVTYVLILANVSIHLWQVGTIQNAAQLYVLYDAFALIPAVATP